MREKLFKAYPPTPASFDARMRRTLNSLPSRRARHPLRAAVAVSLAAVVMLGGLALAVTQSSLLTRIFRGEAPTPQAEALVVSLEETVRADGAALTIDEYLLDGANLYVSWTVSWEGDEPRLLMFSDLETPFEAENDYDDNPVHWLFGSGILLDAEHPVYSAVSRLRFVEDCPEEAFETQLTIALMKPRARMLDKWDTEAFSDTPTLLLSEDSEAGVTFSPASSLSMLEEDMSDLRCEELYDFENSDTFEGMLAALEACGYTETAAQIPVSFTVTPDARRIVHTHVVGQNVFRFEPFTIAVESADFTAAGAHVSLKILIHDAADPWDSLAASLWFEILPDGRATDNGFIQRMTSENNALRCEIEARAGGSIPSRVRIVPTDESGAALYQYAFEIELAQKPGLS